MKSEKLKFDTLLRFAFIETRLSWEDGLAAKDLVGAFDLTRQTAQAVIEDYRQRYPGQMEYDPAKKRHVMTADFQPQHISKRTLDFLDFLRGQQLREGYLDEGMDWYDLKVYDVDKVLRPVLPRHVMQPLLSALRHQRTLLIDYRARTDPIRLRVISPNYLVFVNNRYHVHAYCHSLNKYRDFALSRIVSAEWVEEDWVSGEHSEEWKEQIILRFRPNPALPEMTREALLQGYPGEDEGIWEIHCRRNAAYYIRRKLCYLKDRQTGLVLWQELPVSTA